MKLSNIATGFKPWMNNTLKVLAGVLKQAVFALALGTIWAVYFTSSQDGGWKWSTYIASFSSALAILSILSSQWFRVSKQIRDQDHFGKLTDGVDNLATLMKALSDRQQPSEIVRADQNTDASSATQPLPEVQLEEPNQTRVEKTRVGPQLPYRRIDDFYLPEHYFEYAHDLLLAGQEYPAAWLAAQGFERAVRDVAAKLGLRTNDSLTGIIRSLPASLSDRRLADELLLLARVRNNLAHPVKSHSASSEAEFQLPDRVIQSFEIGARKLRSAIR